jgi:hypothetical protein
MGQGEIECYHPCRHLCDWCERVNCGASFTFVFRSRRPLVRSHGSAFLQAEPR